MVPAGFITVMMVVVMFNPNLPVVVESRCFAEENCVCIIQIGLYYLFIILFYFSAHPIELEGVHILTKAHGRAPV